MESPMNKDNAPVGQDFISGAASDFKDDKPLAGPVGKDGIIHARRDGRVHAVGVKCRSSEASART